MALDRFWLFNGNGFGMASSFDSCRFLSVKGGAQRSWSCRCSYILTTLARNRPLTGMSPIAWLSAILRPTAVQRVQHPQAYLARTKHHWNGDRTGAPPAPPGISWYSDSSKHQAEKYILATTITTQRRCPATSKTRRAWRRVGDE